jgi:hypothetical protein
MDTFVDFITKYLALIVSIIALIFSGISLLISVRKLRVQTEYYKRDTIPNVNIIAKFEKADWSEVKIKSTFNNFGNSTVKLLDLNLNWWLGFKKIDVKSLQHPDLPKTIGPNKNLNLSFTIPESYFKERPSIDFDSILDIFHCELLVEYCSLENEEYIKRELYFVDND